MEQYLDTHMCWYCRRCVYLVGYNSRDQTHDGSRVAGPRQGWWQIQSHGIGWFFFQFWLHYFGYEFDGWNTLEKHKSWMRALWFDPHNHVKIQNFMNCCCNSTFDPFYSPFFPFFYQCTLYIHHCLQKYYTRKWIYSLCDLYLCCLKSRFIL